MASADIYTDKMLFEQVALGDELAFRHVFDRFWPQVYGTSLHLVKKNRRRQGSFPGNIYKTLGKQGPFDKC